MNNEIEGTILRLEQHRNLTLREARGDCVHVHWGRVWITRGGDTRDHVVSGGESLAIDRPGMTVLTAISDAGVSLMKRCDRAAETASLVMQQCAGISNGAASAAADRVVPGADARVQTIGRAYPAYAEIDRHVDYAHQLRARYVADVLANAWAALRGVFTG